MRKILLATAIALLTIMPLRVLAATPGEFHASLLRRGIAAYEAGRHQDAVKNLRLAAFGFVEAIEQYQTAHAYLALAYDQLKDAERTRDSLRRILQAERIERRFGGIAFPPEVRTALLSVAGRVLPATDAETLQTSPPKLATTTTAPPAIQPQTSTQTATQSTTTTSRPGGGVTPPSQPARTPALPEKPAQTQPARPAQTQPAQTQPQPAQTQPAAPRPVPSNQQAATSNQSTSTTTPPRTATTAPTTTTPPATTTPPRPTPPQPQPATISATELANRMIAAERALTASNLTEARHVYREILGANGVARESLVRVAEGLYRARDFTGALAAFDRAGGLRRGEEPYRYYIAVAAYETGQFDRARRELAAALPFIEVTPDVARYKTRIEAAPN